MLDKFLEVSYRAATEKTASRQLVDKLKEFSLDELQKLAAGDETCKLAYAMDACGPGGSDNTWLGKYTGTPLFSKAVELEKALLQLDMEEQQQREQERAARPQPSDVWARRDALQLQKRMLDLDLVMAENGGDPSAAAAPSAEEASTADAPELALEQGGPPKEPKAPKGPPAAPAAEEGPPEAAAGGGEPSEEELLAALQAEGAGAEGAPAQEAGPPQGQPPKPKPKAPPKEEEEPEEEGGPKIEVKQSSAAKIAAIVGAGQFLAKTAKPNAENKVRAEVAKKFPSLKKEAAMPVGAVPGVLGAAAGADKGHASGRPGSAALRGGLGAFGGAELGGQLGLMLGKEHPAAGLAGAALGGLAGYKALTHQYNRKPLDEKTAGLISSVVNAGKAALPAVGGALNAGKSLATQAYQSGGLKQVAGSFGNVARNFAQKNPLAAAGVAGAGGMVAGKMLSNSQPRQ